jgi:hypothetical protein
VLVSLFVERRAVLENKDIYGLKRWYASPSPPLPLLWT